jgi:hypothetical protein
MAPPDTSPPVVSIQTNPSRKLTRLHRNYVLAEQLLGIAQTSEFKAIYKSTDWVDEHSNLTSIVHRCFFEWGVAADERTMVQKHIDCDETMHEKAEWLGTYVKTQMKKNATTTRRKPMA